ncbi:MAG TPA: hypothetical protein VF814_01900 [Casimicrobiaceae bacterium]
MKFLSVLAYGGRHIGTANEARLRLPEASRKLPPASSATQSIGRRPTSSSTTRRGFSSIFPTPMSLAQPWLKGYKQNVFLRYQRKHYEVAAH